MLIKDTKESTKKLPKQIAVLGAAGGLGQGILNVCRAEGISFTAIVRSRPERITNIPKGSRVVVVSSLADRKGLTEAFKGSDAVLTATGITTTSCDASSLLSMNMETIEESMLQAKVNRIIIINSLVSPLPGNTTHWALNIFLWIPGIIGKGAKELKAVVEALGNGAFSSLRWTLVRAAVNSKGKVEAPVATADWKNSTNSMLPVSYESMGRWMLEESVANEFIGCAPLVSRKK